MFHPGGGSATSQVLDLPRADVKAFPCEEHKRYIAVNSTSHEKVRGKLDFYWFVLAPLFNRKVVVSELVPWSQVSSWEVFTLGTYGDPSHNKSLHQFLKEHTPGSLPPLEPFPKSEIATVKRKAADFLKSHFSTIRF